ncbi:MAG: hypothetical protein NZM33_09875 [Bryobacteraceae bacterium]|nr:hypothetical protein [Bryobacteraceae bacterium]
MVKTAWDTSCLVALLCEWHEFHPRTLETYRELRDRGRFIIAGYALLECFSVLTRLPAPARLAPADAARLLRENFAGAEIAAADPQSCRDAIERVAALGIGEGRIYDAVIAYCSYRAGAERLLSWNVRDLAVVSPPGLAMREP